MNKKIKIIIHGQKEILLKHNIISEAKITHN